MSDFKKLFKKYWQFGLLTVITIILLTIVSAMGGDPRQAGSSYNTSPNGYSAWYQMMLDRGIKIERWQKSFAKLTKIYADRSGITLLQVNSKLEQINLTTQQLDWVKQGNKFVILGVTAPAGDLPFSTDLQSDRGNIRIETTRRFTADLAKISLLKNNPTQAILSDQSGNVITKINLGKGRVIIATTPYLAANAYRDFRSNYELLADLVDRDSQQILVDEYVHGYIERKSKSAKSGNINDRELDSAPDKGDVLDYLSRTPLLIVFINLLLGILVLIWQQNRRFGKIVVPKLPEIENSEAYIQALGGVLRQANSSEFVIQNIGKAEQLSWQKKLGLGGERLVGAQTLITAWEERVKLPTDDLRFVLQLTTGSRRLTPTELTLWLTKLQTIDRQLKNYEL
ncbi:MAG: hypothetical protein RLZZ135_462 [Cyanobacteriota bacterium]